MFAAVVASLALASSVAAQAAAPSPTPLSDQHFPFNAIPYMVDTNPTGRGPQTGYNLCNSTTEGPTSECQTAVINSAADFCLWGPPTANSTIADTEAASVAWCSQPGHGTRVIPAGAITAVQFLKTPHYIQVTGFIDQQFVDMQEGDGGGEMDPHGADERGNPLGGLVYSTAFGNEASTVNGYTQVIEWTNFMGSGTFCFKACDPADPEAPTRCQHIFDRIGCAYNAPAAYQPNVFESCLADDADPPGVYTGADGVVTTYVQPPESLGAITSIPYTAKIPASSSCTTYSSAQLFPSNPAPSHALTSSAVTGTPAAATATNKAAGTTTHSATATSTAKSSADGVKFGFGGVWSIAVGVIGAAIGAVVAL